MPVCLLQPGNKLFILFDCFRNTGVTLTGPSSFSVQSSKHLASGPWGVIMECRVAPPGQKPSSLASYLNFEDIFRIRWSIMSMEYPQKENKPLRTWLRLNVVLVLAYSSASLPACLFELSLACSINLSSHLLAHLSSCLLELSLACSLELLLELLLVACFISCFLSCILPCLMLA